MTDSTEASGFGWSRIVRLGLVQAAMGAVVVLTTSTLNRVMVVELALPALLPGILVAFHYLVQIARPRMGHGSDVGGRRTPWIIGGMGVLALGGFGAALSVALMTSQRSWGIACAFVAFALIGLGVSASGTSLLVLLAKRVAPTRRAAAATVVWLMMIVGFAVTAGICGQLLDPYSPSRLVAVSGAVSVIAVAVTMITMRGLEGPAAARAHGHVAEPAAAAPRPAFKEALARAWAEPQARRFTIFVFVSMLAFSAQDLILEPFAGAVFGFTPGQSTSLSGVQHGGVLLGMLLAALAGSRWGGRTLGSLRAWTIAGCIASALALAGLAVAGMVGAAWPFKTTVFLLGAANGVFSIAAIGSMMRLAGADSQPGGPPSEGVRMGLWGAAQALAFGLGGLLGAGASDLARALIGTPGAAYAAVFAFEALLFLVSARLAAGIGAPQGVHAAPHGVPAAPQRAPAAWGVGEHPGTA
jgi:BCD family chlorophyll transporter-like MFS transporter